MSVACAVRLNTVRPERQRRDTLTLHLLHDCTCCIFANQLLDQNIFYEEFLQSVWLVFFEKMFLLCWHVSAGGRNFHFLQVQLHPQGILNSTFWHKHSVQPLMEFKGQGQGHYDLINVLSIKIWHKCSFRLTCRIQVIKPKHLRFAAWLCFSWIQRCFRCSSQNWM